MICGMSLLPYGVEASPFVYELAGDPRALSTPDTGLEGCLLGVEYPLTREAPSGEEYPLWFPLIRVGACR